MKRQFKLVENSDGIFLYPIPVIKEKKYLIQCSSHDAAQEFIKSIQNGEIFHPDQETIIAQKFHSDGQTPIFSTTDYVKCSKGS